MADYVSKYTGSQVDGILDRAIELPRIASNDRGKVLTVDGTGEAVWTSLPGSLPFDSHMLPLRNTDDGCVLMADDGEFVLARTLPICYAQDAGKVLTLSSTLNGNIAWADIPNYLEWTNILPSYSTNGQSNGRVLAVMDNEVTWTDIIPSYDFNSQEGRVLTVGNSKLEWTDVLPSYYTNGNSNGQVLAVMDNEVAWTEVIPAYDKDVDNGKVLVVSAHEGSLTWATLSEIQNNDF